MFQDKKIGIIGFGNMGEAILKSLLDKGVAQKPNTYVSDSDQGRALYARSKYAANHSKTNKELLASVDIVILAIKPQDLKALSSEISKDLRPNTLVISILAGVSTKKLESLFKGKPHIIRVMPNMPAKVGFGVSAISAGKHAGDQDKKNAAVIFRAVGDVIELDEELMNAVTAISGSGPAYFFYLVELLIRAGVSYGLSFDLAKTLAMKTFQGSARLMESLNEEPEFLRKKITSKGGTTEAAFKVFEKRKFEDVFMAAISAAAKRSKELSRG